MSTRLFRSRKQGRSGSADASPDTARIQVEPRRSRRATALAIVLVLTAFATVLAGVQSQLFDLERHTVAKELALNAGAFVALLLLLPRWRRIEATLIEALLAAFLAWSALSALLARNHWLALRALGVTFSGFVLFIAARRAAAGGRGRLVLGGLAAAALVAAGLGVAQAYGADWQWLTRSRPPGGTFGNRNFLAHLTAIALPVLVLAAMRVRRRAALGLALLALAVAAAAIVLTRSRAAWLGAIAALAVMGLAALAGHRAIGSLHRRPATALAMIALGAILAVVLPNRLEWRSDSPYAETLTRLTSYRGGSGHGRLIQWSNSLRLVPDRPVFGVGPGNWFIHYPRVTTPGDPAFVSADPIPTNPWPSSDWVALLTERGAFAVLLVLLAGAAAAITAMRRLFGDDPGAALRSAALLGTLVAATVTGLFDAVMLLAAPMCFVAAAVGALLPDSRPVLDRPFPARRRRTLLVVPLAFAALFTALSSAQLAAIIVTQKSPSRAALEKGVLLYPGSYRLQLLLARRGPCSRRLPHARAAARLMPYHPAPRAALAACGVQPDPKTQR